MVVNNPSERLRQVRCYILDMDGTFYLGDRLLPGALEFIALLKQRNIPFIFLTNNSSRSRVQYAQKLRHLGLKDLQDTQVLTSGEATASYLLQHLPTARLFVVGTPVLEVEFSARGFSLTSDNPDAVVLGFDTTLTYEKLRLLCNWVRAGKPFYATHPDINCPTEDGFMPDIGAILALVEASTDRKPDVIIGKPYPYIVEAMVKKTGFEADKLAMVGDRLYTDIALGKTGMATILVLSGETHRTDLAGSSYQPDLVVENLSGLVEFIL